MAAFRRRTAFAAPLIVIAGCGGKEPASFPGQRWNVFKQPDGSCKADLVIDCPKNVACNPPAPADIECPAGMTTALGVAQRVDKTCAVIPADCTSIDCAKQTTPCPTYGAPKPPPEPPKLVAIWSIQVGRTSPDSCEAYDELACSVPPGQPAPPCNPPPPMPVVCPTGFRMDQPMRIGQLPNSSCVIAPPACMDTSCAKVTIACPEPAPPK